MDLFKKSFLNKEEETSLVSAIKSAEQNTSGEIRVHFSPKIVTDVFSDAKAVFEKLEMHLTEKRNGVLIYLVPNERQFAIIGDEGINSITGEDFWVKVKNEMQAEFNQGNMLQGLLTGVAEVGLVLKSQFPYHQDDKNELSDEISYGE